MARAFVQLKIQLHGAMRAREIRTAPGARFSPPAEFHFGKEAFFAPLRGARSILGYFPVAGRKKPRPFTPGYDSHHRFAVAPVPRPWATEFRLGRLPLHDRRARDAHDLQQTDQLAAYYGGGGQQKTFPAGIRFREDVVLVVEVVEELG